MLKAGADPCVRPVGFKVGADAHIGPFFGENIRGDVGIAPYLRFNIRPEKMTPIPKTDF